MLHLDLDRDIWSAEFSNTAQRVVRRAIADLGRRSPVLAEHISKWISLRCDVGQPEEYFIRPQSLPVLALPWWLESSIRGEVDVDFQADLMCSSVNGYYFIRMLDDIMDGHEVDRAAMPALHPFHAHFVSTYFRYFQASDPFWQDFERLLMATVEAVTAEATLKDFGEAEFVRVNARKSTAGVIPLAAVCFRYRRPDLLQSWEELVTRFGRWHQMRDDLVDWSVDCEIGNRTWLLCEADRRRAEHESVSEWMGREGFQWAKSVMEPWIEDALTTATGLGSQQLVRYLGVRRESFSAYISTMVETAAALSKLLHLDSCPST